MQSTDVPPRTELARRMNDFRDVLRERKLTAALIVDACNVRYLSGFTGSDSALLVTRDEQFLLTDYRYLSEAAESARGWTPIDEPAGLMEKAGHIARKKRVKVLAIEPGAMRLTDMPPLRRAAGNVTLKQEHGMVAELRLFKSPWEIACMEAALRIQESCFVDVCAAMRKGVEEREAAAELRHRMTLAGAHDQAFDILFQFGSSSSLPHGRPTARRLSAQCIVLADWGVRFRGYHTDLTRTFFWGKIPPQLRRIHAAVLQAHRALIDRIMPGVEIVDLHKAAHAVIGSAGYEKGFRHAAGHGIGLEVHEYPSISELSKGSLREGMVLAVEPGVYVPGVAGIRVEDMVLVTKTGCRVLSRLKHGVRWDGSGE